MYELSTANCVEVVTMPALSDAKTSSPRRRPAETTENGFQATVVRRPTAASLQGALKGSVKYVGQEAERLAVAAALAEKLRR